MRDALVSYPVRRSGLQVEHGRESHVLHDQAGSLALALNESALALWELCDGHTTEEEMVAAVSEACNIPSTRAAQDVSEALERFTSLGLVDWYQPGRDASQ
jgi:hypothetical protein